MKKSTFLKSLLVFSCLSLVFGAVCQPPPAPPPPGAPSGVPLDGGVVGMLIGLGAYGLKKYFIVDVKKVYSLLILTLIFSFSNAQKLDWAVVFGGTDQDFIVKTVTDQDGNIYSTGGTDGSMDLDPGLGVDLHVGSGSNNRDFFIQKIDSNGNFIWGRTIVGSSNDHIEDMAIDNLGNLVLVGSFTGTVDFDPGPGVHVESSSGFNNYDGFILKIDKDGIFVWVRTLNSSGASAVESVAISSTNEIYVTGLFSVTTDFDFGSGVSNLSPSFGARRYFLKVDSNGTFAWVYKIESNDYVYVSYSDNSLVLGGYFFGTRDLDPSAGVDTYTPTYSSALFITKFDEAGNYGYTKIINNQNFSYITSVEQDMFGNIYALGQYSGTIDFNPNAGVNNMTSVGYGNTFLLKLDINGNYVWARSIGENNNGRIIQFVVDVSENVYSVGYFQGSFDLDPGPSQIIETAPSRDLFTLKLNANGQYVYHRIISSARGDFGTSIALNNSNELIVSGHTSSVSAGFGIPPEDIDFNINYCPYILSGFGNSDPFIAKFRQRVSIWTGQTNSDWNTASNWLGGVPDSDSDIRIPDLSGSSNVYPVINLPTLIGQVTVDSNATLIINEGIILNGSFLNNGTVILKDGAYLDEFTNNQCYIGDITVETIAANGVSLDQRMISSPINNANVSEIGDDLNGPWGQGLVGADNVALTVNCGANS